MVEASGLYAYNSIGMAKLLLDGSGDNSIPAPQPTPAQPAPTEPAAPPVPTQPIPTEPTPPQSFNLVDTIPPYNTETTSTYYDSYYPSTGNKSIKMGGKTYKNAIMLSSSGTAKIYFNLEGKYTTLTGIVGHIDEMSKDNTVVNVYGDGKLLRSFDVPAGGLPTAFSVDVSGVSNFMVEASGLYAYNSIGMAELVVK